jgi:hypothetical protein
VDRSSTVARDGSRRSRDEADRPPTGAAAGLATGTDTVKLASGVGGSGDVVGLLPSHPVPFRVKGAATAAVRADGSAPARATALATVSPL